MSFISQITRQASISTAWCVFFWLIQIICVLCSGAHTGFPGCSPPGRRPFKNLQLFNISLWLYKILFFFIKSIWFSSLLFWAKRLYSSCVAPVSESWCEFLGTPSWPTSDHKTSILLKDFDAFSSKPQFYLRKFVFLASSPLLGSLAPPWEPLGNPWCLRELARISWDPFLAHFGS